MLQVGIKEGMVGGHEQMCSCDMLAHKMQSQVTGQAAKQWHATHG
jgi:hypothetical protein